jgi:hypothetical protein
MYEGRRLDRAEPGADPPFELVALSEYPRAYKVAHGTPRC